MNDDELKKFQEESSNLKFGPINKYWYMVMVNCNLLGNQYKYSQINKFNLKIRMHLKV